MLCRRPLYGGPWEGIARRQRLISHVEQAGKGLPDGCLFYGSEGEDGSLPAWLARTFADRELILPEPSEEELNKILAAIGKRTLQDELNCGACGYDSCRDKARAVYLGVAEREMCIPYMRAKAESLAQLIIESTPNGIIVVDDTLTILAVNPAAEIMFGYRAQDLIDQPLSQLITTSSFERVLKTGRLIKEIVEYSGHQITVRQYVFSESGYCHWHLHRYYRRSGAPG